MVRPASAQTLASQSDVVVHARVVEQWVVQKRGLKGEIFTRSVLEIIEYFRGDGPEVLTVQQLGGTLGEFHLNVVGTPALAVGSEIVAFLKVDSQRQLSFIVGLAQGIYYVESVGDAPWVYQDLSGLSFYTRTPQRVRPKPGGIDSSLGQLRRKVQGLKVFSTFGAKTLRALP